ncbi:hypothetical protein ACTFIZ_002775 [Dictyostelium cf. discoideum]
MHIRLLFFDVVTYNNLKFYNYLKSINAIPTSHIKQRFYNISLSDSLSFDYKFKRLIKSYKLLIDPTKFKQLQEIHQKQQLNLNSNYNKYIEKLNQLILELNEVRLSHFTNDQLNSTIRNLLNQTTTTPILSVSQLYEIFYEFHFKNKNDYFLFFKSILMDQNLEKNQRLELISNIMDIENGIPFQIVGNSYNLISERFKSGSFNSFCRAVFSINDAELIDHLFKIIKKLQLVQNSKTTFPTISQIISTSFQYINKKEIVDFFFENYRNETTLFDDQSQLWNNNNHINIIDHIETLMETIGKKLRLCFANCYDWFKNDKNNQKNNINILLDQLKRVISKPLLYSISFYFDGSVYDGYLFKIFVWSLENGNEVLINYFLSSKQFQLSFRFSQIFGDAPPNKMPNSPKLIFNNISKESIESKLYQARAKGYFNNSHGNYDDNNFIQLTSAITKTNSKEVEPCIIDKTESFDFIILPRTLFVCLYYLNRIDDIFYLFDKIPEIFNLAYFSHFTKQYYLYNISSSYYLELFINYFIENLNDNTINHLHTCLYVASEKGFTQIFKNIISSNQNSQNLLKV